MNGGPGAPTRRSIVYHRAAGQGKTSKGTEQKQYFEKDLVGLGLLVGG